MHLCGWLHIKISRVVLAEPGVKALQALEVAARDDSIWCDCVSTDDEFEPKLGRIRSHPKGKTGSALKRIARDLARAGGSRGKGRARFDGSRVGRGAGVGRVLRSSDRYGGKRNRRVVIQTRIVKL